MKIKKLFFIFFLALCLSGCNFDSENEDEDLSYEDTSYNPSITELQAGGIPIVELTVPGGITSRTNYKEDNVSITISTPDSTGNFIEDFSTTNFKIKGRGNSSWSHSNKKSYTIKLTNKSEILNMKEAKKWVLIGNYSDKSLLRNFFASRLGNELYNTTWNPSFKSVNLIINGNYRGVYLFGECVQINKKRVKINNTLEDNDNGGFIFEINHWADEFLNFKTSHNVEISLKDPDDEISAAKQEFVKEIIQNAENSLYSINYKNPSIDSNILTKQNSVQKLVIIYSII